MISADAAVMDVDTAIRARRSVRRYTDRPVAPTTVDELVRLALRAPTGSLADAWSLVVVRDAGSRARLAEIVVAGAQEYFRTVVAPSPGTDAGAHRAWARELAETVMGLSTYRLVPVWIVGVVVPRGIRPAEDRDLDAADDLISLGFALENLFLAARARGLGTVPTSFHRYDESAVRDLLGIPEELDVPIVTPLGHPEEFPEGLPAPLAALRHHPDTLVRDDHWDRPRREPVPVPTVRSLLGGSS